MSKAEDLAKELYPDWEMTGVPYVDGQEESMIRIQRVAYVKGYHQAEKDLELTWKDIVMIDKLLIGLGITFPCKSTPDYYQEVLERFKDLKERK